MCYNIVQMWYRLHLWNSCGANVVQTCISISGKQSVQRGGYARPGPAPPKHKARGTAAAYVPCLGPEHPDGMERAAASCILGHCQRVVDKVS